MAKELSTRSDDLGKLVLRSALAILILLHGIAKLSGGVGFITGMLANFGLPGVLRVRRLCRRSRRAGAGAGWPVDPPRRRWSW